VIGETSILTLIVGTLIEAQSETGCPKPSGTQRLVVQKDSLCLCWYDNSAAESIAPLFAYVFVRSDTRNVCYSNLCVKRVFELPPSIKLLTLHMLHK
jgi:hypothetical protein